MTCVGTMKPLTAWSSRFSRSKQFEPPEGGTPNQHKFMESPLSLFRMHWDHEPRQLVGRGVLTAPRLGGLGTARPTLRFMERGRDFLPLVSRRTHSIRWGDSAIANCGHVPYNRSAP